MLILAHRGNIGYPLHEASRHLHEALERLRSRSAAAREIIDFVDRRDHRSIRILVTERPGAFGTSNPAVGFVEPCILWSPVRETTIRYSASRYHPGQRGLAYAVYPPEITLIHEIGHAKQYIEDPARFPSYDREWTLIPGTLPNDAIEADNLRRHEHPVCNDYGLPTRTHYSHFV